MYLIVCRVSIRIFAFFSPKLCPLGIWFVAGGVKIHTPLRATLVSFIFSLKLGVVIVKCGCAGVVWQARRRWPTRLARPPDQHTGHMCLNFFWKLVFLVLAFRGSLGSSLASVSSWLLPWGPWQQT